MVRAFAASTIATSRQRERGVQPTITSPRVSDTAASRSRRTVRPVRGSQRTSARPRWRTSPPRTAAATQLPGTRLLLAAVTRPSTATSRTPTIRRRSQSTPASHTRPGVADGTNWCAGPRRTGGRSSATGMEKTVVRLPRSPANTMWPAVTNTSGPQVATADTRRARRRPLATSTAVSRLPSVT